MIRRGNKIVISTSCAMRVYFLFRTISLSFIKPVRSILVYQPFSARVSVEPISKNKTPQPVLQIQSSLVYHSILLYIVVYSTTVIRYLIASNWYQWRWWNQQQPIGILTERELDRFRLRDCTTMDSSYDCEERIINHNNDDFPFRQKAAMGGADTLLHHVRLICCCWCTCYCYCCCCS